LSFYGTSVVKTSAAKTDFYDYSPRAILSSNSPGDDDHYLRCDELRTRNPHFRRSPDSFTLELCYSNDQATRQFRMYRAEVNSAYRLRFAPLTREPLGFDYGFDLLIVAGR
jgi:hypothetical protein